MRTLKTPAVILNGVYCKSLFTGQRIFCPRGIYLWCREIWLEKSSESTVAQTAQSAEGGCHAALTTALAATPLQSTSPIVPSGQTQSGLAQSPWVDATRPHAIGAGPAPGLELLTVEVHHLPRRAAYPCNLQSQRATIKLEGGT